MKIQYFWIPIYRGHLVVAVGDDIEKLQDRFPGCRFGKDIYAEVHFPVTWKGHESVLVIFNPKNPGRKLTHGCIAHEAIHAANFILAERGVECHPRNDEPLAYLTEWMVDKINSVLKKNKIRLLWDGSNF